MKNATLAMLRCPTDRAPLTRIEGRIEGGEIFGGALVSQGGRRYPIEDGIPNFLVSEALTAIERQEKAEYDRVADDIYDRAVDWQFAAFLEDENAVREGMLDILGIDPSMRILEIGCGTGRDSHRIARRLGPDGELHMQDLSPGMTRACRRKMAERAAGSHSGPALDYSISSATALPYADEAFDAVFHFGGFNHFGDLKAAAAEMTRVVRRGGRVLYGDEAVAPWLKGSEFDGVVSANNALFKADIPLASLPDCARDVTASWIIANCFYVIAYTRGEGPPPLDLDLPHTGLRGGSLRSRYFGVLEGVSIDTKARVRDAAAKAGLSIHDWLERTLRAATEGRRE